MTDTTEVIKVVVAFEFSDEIIEHLKAISPRLHIERHFPNVPDSAWADVEVLYTASKLPDPQQVPRLRWIQFHSAGLDHAIDHAIVRAEDVEITSASGIHATQMAELTLAMMLGFAYKLPTMLKLQERAEWPKQKYDTFTPSTLRDQTVGIVGYGSVGRELGRILDSLGMTVLATKRNLLHTLEDTEYVEPGLGDAHADIPARLYPPEALASMVHECDFVVLIVPLTPQTHYMVNEHILKSMKKTAVLINMARGAVVDEKALISALANGTIAGAGLDVFEEEPLPSTSPLWNMDNVIISPHIGGMSTRYHEKAAALFADNLQRYLEQRPLLNRLDRQRGY